MAITAKVVLQSKTPQGEGQEQLTFGPDYADGRNQEWSKYTPSLGVWLNVLTEVADNFELQGKYTLTFTPSA